MSGGDAADSAASYMGSIVLSAEPEATAPTHPPPLRPTEESTLHFPFFNDDVQPCSL